MLTASRAGVMMWKDFSRPYLHSERSGIGRSRNKGNVGEPAVGSSSEITNECFSQDIIGDVDIGVV